VQVLVQATVQVLAAAPAGQHATTESLQPLPLLHPLL
jgi:hypothetical protein